MQLKCIQLELKIIKIKSENQYVALFLETKMWRKIFFFAKYILRWAVFAQELKKYLIRVYFSNFALLSAPQG